MHEDGIRHAEDPPTALSSPTPQPLGRGKRLAFTAVALLLGWMALEVGGYLLYWLAAGTPFSWDAMQAQRRNRANRPEGAEAAAYAQVHPFVGFVEEPRADSGVRPLVGGPPVPVSSFGYLDEEDPIHRRGPDRVVIGITGGSVACFFAINGTRRLEVVLAKDPTFEGKRFVFVNLALFGYKQPQQLLTLAYLLSLGAEFDLIVNIDGFNEVALYELENASHHVFPAFPRSWHARVGVNDPAAGLTRGRLLVIDEQRTDLARWASSAPWRYSVLCNVAWQLGDRWLDRRAYSIVERYYRSSTRRGPYVATGPPREFAGPDDLYDHLASIWANASTEMDQLCRGRGTRYLHFLQPNQYVPGSKTMSEAERRVAILPGHPYRRGVELGYPRLERDGRALQRKGVAFHDLTRIFADHSEETYIDGCCHYTQAGYEIMARAIADAIRRDSEAARAKGDTAGG